MAKIGGYRCVLLAVAVVLTGCLADPGPATNEGAVGSDPDGGEGTNRVGPGDSLDISKQVVSASDSSNTVSAISAGLNPDITLLDGDFGCYTADQIDIRETVFDLNVDGSTYSGQFVGTNSSLTGTITQLDAKKSSDDDLEFVGGYLDGQGIKVRFDSYGQEFEVSIQKDATEQSHFDRFYCYQGGAKFEQEYAELLLKIPEPGTFNCTSPEDSIVQKVEVAKDATYKTANGSGRFGLTDLVGSRQSQLDFSQGPLDGVSARYGENPDTGFQSFEVSTSSGFLTSASSTLDYVCSRVRQPRPFKLYGPSEAPNPPKPSASLEGLHFVPYINVGVNESSTGAHFYKFYENGYIHRGALTAASGDCSRTAPNGLPYCRTYTVQDGQLVVGPPAGAPWTGSNEWSVETDGSRLKRIGADIAELVTPVDPNKLVGVWQNSSFSSSGPDSAAFSSQQQYGFDKEGRFVANSSSLTTSDIESGLGRSLGTATSAVGDRGSYETDGNWLILNYDNGVLETRFVYVTNSGQLAMDGQLFFPPTN